MAEPHDHRTPIINALKKRPGWEPAPFSLDDDGTIWDAEPGFTYTPAFAGHPLPPGVEEEEEPGDVVLHNLMIYVDLAGAPNSEYHLVTAGILGGCPQHQAHEHRFPLTPEGLAALLAALPPHEQHAAALDLDEYLQHLDNHCIHNLA